MTEWQPCTTLFAQPSQVRRSKFSKWHTDVQDVFRVTTGTTIDIFSKDIVRLPSYLLITATLDKLCLVGLLFLDKILLGEMGSTQKNPGSISFSPSEISECIQS